MEHKHYPLAKKRHYLLPGLTGLYLHTLLRDIGRSLVSIFLPIYVYNLTGNLILPFLMHGIYHLTVVLTAVWVPKIINKIGLDWSAAIGAFLRIMVLILALKAENNIALLGPAYVFWGMLIIFTWIPHHYNILQVDKGDHKFGKKSSFILINSVPIFFMPKLVFHRNIPYQSKKLPNKRACHNAEYSTCCGKSYIKIITIMKYCMIWI